jgi:glyoxylase-like metal-dependent hydrolase (beta-lactamase superfamily II)
MPVAVSAWELGELGHFQFEKINDQAYVMHGPLEEPNKANQGFMNNPGIIVAEKGIIVVDPGGTYPVGKQVLKEIEKISRLPVVAVFDSHIHGDHWLANQAIKEAYPEVKMYAHPQMIKQANSSPGLQWIDLMERTTEGQSRGTVIVSPTLSVDQSDEIEIIGQHFRIHSILPAHTNTDIMLEHVESRTLFMGDNSFVNRMGRFDESSSMHGNIDSLKYAKKLHMKVYVPGHGPSGDADTVINPFLDYLVRLQRAVKKGFDNDLEDYEIKDNIIAQFEAYKNWTGFDKNFGKHVNKMYLEIENLDL